MPHSTPHSSPDQANLKVLLKLNENKGWTGNCGKNRSMNFVFLDLKEVSGMDYYRRGEEEREVGNLFSLLFGALTSLRSQGSQ
jgi:hypothetical protein